ncbi:MAG: isoprenylcysteine carboxylmethyltransferase family protein [Xanthobacteraceae bacterium]|nr:isoprenylcysteine carboxylmethyltransferase family protein [Xanthobacteraceae bacterium]
MSRGNNDVPNVIARPPLIVLATVIAAFALDYFFPQGHMARTANGLRYLSAGVALLCGLVLLGSAANEMRKEGTNIPTWEPSLALVTSGIYTRSRNPIYLAFIILLIGLGLLVSSDWLFLLLIPFVLIIHYGVIRREEEYLLARFGAPYANYLKQVPRYLLGI